jgi:hypothetical protein
MLRQVTSLKTTPAWSRRPALRLTKAAARERRYEEPHHIMRAAGVLNLEPRFGKAAATALLARQDQHLGAALVVQRQPKPNPVGQAGRALR